MSWRYHDWVGPSEKWGEAFWLNLTFIFTVIYLYFLILKWLNWSIVAYKSAWEMFGCCRACGAYIITCYTLGICCRNRHILQITISLLLCKLHVNIIRCLCNSNFDSSESCTLRPPRLHFESRCGSSISQIPRGRQPMISFHKRFIRGKLKFRRHYFCSNFDYNGQIASQFYTWHDSAAVLQIYDLNILVCDGKTAQTIARFRL